MTNKQTTKQLLNKYFKEEMRKTLKYRIYLIVMMCLAASLFIMSVYFLCIRGENIFIGSAVFTGVVFFVALSFWPKRITALTKAVNRVAKEDKEFSDDLQKVTDMWSKQTFNHL